MTRTPLPVLQVAVQNHADHLPAYEVAEVVAGLLPKRLARFLPVWDLRGVDPEEPDAKLGPIVGSAVMVSPSATRWTEADKKRGDAPEAEVTQIRETAKTSQGKRSQERWPYIHVAAGAKFEGSSATGNRA